VLAERDGVQVAKGPVGQRTILDLLLQFTELSNNGVL
jgi:hypothetical protein